MFNFKKAQKQFVSSFQPTITVEMIHNDFDTAVDELINKAINIDQFKKDKHDKLKALGFVSAKDVVEISGKIHESEEQARISALVNHYRTYYPNNKFITKSLVDSICKKYGLAQASVGYYIGTIPDSNIEEISSFKLREEDMKQHKNTYFNHDGTRTDKKTQYYGYMTSRNWFSNVDESKEFSYEKEEFEICAPIKDFDTRYLKLEGTNLVPKDPIVLQPVNGGYLIVSKWGLEASDKDLVNEINN